MAVIHQIMLGVARCLIRLRLDNAVLIGHFRLSEGLDVVILDRILGWATPLALHWLLFFASGIDSMGTPLSINLSGTVEARRDVGRRRHIARGDSLGERLVGFGYLLQTFSSRAVALLRKVKHSFSEWVGELDCCNLWHNSFLFEYSKLETN